MYKNNYFNFKDIKPKINSKQILIEVYFISIIPDEEVWTKIYENKDKKEILESFRYYDVSGIIIEIGDEVRNFKKGDHVFGVANFEYNTLSKYAIVLELEIAKSPKSISFLLSSIVPSSCIILLNELSKKELNKKNILIHYGTTNIGNLAIQISSINNLNVISTCPEKFKHFYNNLGVNKIINK